MAYGKETSNKEKPISNQEINSQKEKAPEYRYFNPSNLKGYSELKNEVFNRLDSVGDKLGAYDEYILKTRIKEANNFTDDEASKALDELRRSVVQDKLIQNRYK